MKAVRGLSQATAGTATFPKGWSGTVHRLSQPFQRPIQQHSQAGFHWLSEAFAGFPEAAPTAGVAAFTGFHRLSQPFQIAFQRLEQQRPTVGATVFTGFHRLSRGRSNGWNGSAHRLSPVPATVPMVGTVVLTGFHRFQRPFQWLEQQRESFRETPAVGTVAFTGIHFYRLPENPPVHRLSQASQRPF